MKRVTQRGKKKKRKSPARVEIEVWMLRAGLRKTDVALALKVDRSAISHFLNGKLESARIKKFFVKKGCPAELLEQRAKVS